MPRRPRRTPPQPGHAKPGAPGAPPERLIITQPEAEILAGLLAGVLDELGRGTTDEYRGRLWRLALKLDQAVGQGAFLADMLMEPPPWVRAILYKTFLPQPAPVKPPAPSRPPRRPTGTAARARPRSAAPDRTPPAGAAAGPPALQ